MTAKVQVRLCVVLIAVIALALPLPRATGNPIVQYFYDDLGRLSKVVDQNGNTATYNYDAVGNLLSISRSAIPANNGLAVLNFTPRSGAISQSVLIQGQGFSSTASGNTVRFNGTPTTVTAATTTTLSVVVPNGATTGPISVTVGGQSAASDIAFTVTKTLTSIAVSPGSALLVLGTQSQQFAAIGTYSDGSTQDLTTATTWSSSDINIARVSNATGSQGQTTGIAGGTATVGATITTAASTFNATATLTVTSTLVLNPANSSISKGTTQQFTATAGAQDFTSTATWISSDPSIATVSNGPGSQGLVTAVGVGATTIGATSGSLSGSTGLIVNGGAAAVVPRFALVANNDGTISVSGVNPSTGRLRSNGYEFNGLSGALAAVAIDPSGKFAYVANGVGNNGVSAFSVSAKGILTPLPGSPFATGVSPVAVAIDPLDRFAYVVNRDSASISAYTLNATSGVLTPTPNSPFVGGSGGPPAESPFSICVDPAGKFVFVAESGTSGIAVYAINQQTGDLTELPASPFLAGAAPVSVAIDPTGTFVYSANDGDNSVSAFTVDSSNGNLTPVANSPFAVGQEPFAVTVDPSGKFVYVANSGDRTISAFTIAPATGALAAVSGSPYVTGTGPESITVDPSDRFVYVVNRFDDTVSTFGIDPNTGGLTALASVPGRTPSALAIVPGPSAVAYVPQFAYVVNAGPPTPNGSNNVSAFTITPSTGALSAANGSPFAEGLSPEGVAASPMAQFLYITNNCSDPVCSAIAGSVSAFTIDSVAGALTTITGSPFLAGQAPRGAVIDPSGRFAYAANNTDSTISAYAIDPVTGALSPIPGSPFATAMSPVSVTIDSTGSFLYALGSCSGTPCGLGSIWSYTIAPTTGMLTSSGTFPVGNGPQTVAVDPTAQFVYVVNTIDGSVSAFSISRPTGSLTAVTGSPFTTGPNPASVAIEPTGRFAYATNSGTNTVSAYSIDPFLGVLAPVSGGPFGTGVRPTSAAVDTSGLYLYVVNANDNTVSAFAINPTSGALAPVTGSPFVTGSGPVSITTTGKTQ